MACLLYTSQSHDEISVVCDQHGAPTYTYDVARLLCDVIASHKYGVYPAPNEGDIPWYDFAVEIFRQAGKDTKVIPVSTEESVSYTHLSIVTPHFLHTAVA